MEFDATHPNRHARTIAEHLKELGHIHNDIEWHTSEIRAREERERALKRAIVAERDLAGDTLPSDLREKVDAIHPPKPQKNGGDGRSLAEVVLLVFQENPNLVMNAEMVLDRIGQTEIEIGERSIPNALGYLDRTGQIKRVRHGFYQMKEGHRN